MRPILVFGCPPGPALAARADRAAALWRAGVADIVVFSGAKEAGWAAAKIVEGGIPETSVRVEPDARDTRENAARCRALLPDVRDVWLVTDRWHMRRAMLWARRFGFEPWPSAVPVGGVGWRRHLYRSREVLALLGALGSTA